MLKHYLKKLRSLNAQTLGLFCRGSVSRNLGRFAVVVLIVILVSTHSAHAEGWFGIPTIWEFLTQTLAFLINVALSIASWFVALTGMLLNVSVLLTMNIKDFVDSTPAIYTVWKAIRDITGMFIIFALLYASIKMIIGLNAKLGDTIKNIIIAGVLINFSFLLTAFLIDASNVVSLQLYKAITPGQADISASLRNSNAAGSGLSAIIDSSFKDGGLSAVFMQSLKIQTVFNPKNLDLQGNNGSTGMVPFKMIFIGIAGFIIMITAGLSFLFAALAFIVRLVLLLMLLAFSPIWCAAYVIPQLKEYSQEYWKVLTAQLTFMPAYLLLMYVALQIITGSSLFNSGAYTALWQGEATGVPKEFITLFINFALIIIMLNLPLLAAIKLGASTGGLLDGKKLGADAIWKKVGSWSRQGVTQGASTTWRETGGRVASRLAQNASFQTYAGRSIVGQALLQRTRATATGYNKKLTEQTTEREQFAQSLNRQGATAYADRLSTSVRSRVGQSVLHVIGRADRVGAARILTTRFNEINTDLNRLNSELNGIVNASNQINPATGIAFGLAGLPLNQQQRHDLLTGNNVTHINDITPTHPTVTNEIADAQNDLRNIRTQMNTFQTNTGASTRDTTKRNY